MRRLLGSLGGIWIWSIQSRSGCGSIEPSKSSTGLLVAKGVRSTSMALGTALVGQSGDALRLKLAGLDNEYRDLNSRKIPDSDEVGPHGFTALEMETAMEAWVTRVANLVEFVSLNEELRIPEFDLLEAEDWLAAVQEDKLETVADYRLLLARVRQMAKLKTYQSLASTFIACRNRLRQGYDRQERQPYIEIAPMLNYCHPPIDTRSNGPRRRIW